MFFSEHLHQSGKVWNNPEITLTFHLAFKAVICSSVGFPPEVWRLNHFYDIQCYFSWFSLVAGMKKNWKTARQCFLKIRKCCPDFIKKNTHMKKADHIWAYLKSVIGGEEIWLSGWQKKKSEGQLSSWLHVDDSSYVFGLPYTPPPPPRLFNTLFFSHHGLRLEAGTASDVSSLKVLSYGGH